MGIAGSKAAAAYNIRHCTLWKADRSPACRAVMMALDCMNLSITEVDLNLDKNEHKTEGMTMLNPLQTVPVFKDKDLVLFDSHAICTYLVDRYGQPDLLIPRDPRGRSQVNQQLHYNSGVLYPRFRAAAYPILYENCNFIMPQQIVEIESAYCELEQMLDNKEWFGGDSATLSDIVFASTISTLNILVPIDQERFPMLRKWHNKVSEELFFITANRKGLSEFTRRIDPGCGKEFLEFKCPRTSNERRDILQKDIKCRPEGNNECE